MRKILNVTAAVGLIAIAACSHAKRSSTTTAAEEGVDQNKRAESSRGTNVPTGTARTPISEMDANRNNINTSRRGNSIPSDRRSVEAFDDRGTSSSGFEDNRSSHDAVERRDRMVNPRLSNTQKSQIPPAAPAPTSGSTGTNTVTD